jgi:DNA repair ATPase RecN
MKKLKKKERLKEIARLLEGVWVTTRADRDRILQAQRLAKGDDNG